MAMPVGACTMLSKPRRPAQGPRCPQAIEVHDDKTRVPLGQGLFAEAEPVECAGSVAAHDDVGLFQQIVCGGQH